MQADRKIKLQRNFKLMFWVQALTQVRIINVVSTLFMVSRGLSLSQIFLTAVVFSVVAILTELPSSYLADRWSRKGLVTISVALGAFYWFFNMFAYGFPAFVVAISLFSLSYSLMSGTDEALVYDSAKEIGEERSSIKMLGRFYAASRFFKIFSPMLAVLIAANLSDFQFRIILGIDLVANLLALFLTDFMVEPNHLQNKEKINNGVLKDTIRLFTESSTLVKVTINRTLIFLASFAIWRISSEYLYSIGTSLIWIGLGTTAFQISLFTLNMKSHSWFKKWDSEEIIKYLNYTCIALLGLFLINEITGKNWIVALIILSLIFIIEGARNPYFSDLINKGSHSYNRATTISGSNLMTELIKLPALVFCSWLINFGYVYLFLGALVLAILTEMLFSLKKKDELLIK